MKTSLEETGEKMKKREFGPDLTRAAAVGFVLAIHFFLYTGFYDTLLAGTGMAAAATVRMALMTCVPLFLVLTGYLCAGKTWSKGYYRGSVRTLVIYLLACAVCLLFRRFYLGEEIIFWARSGAFWISPPHLIAGISRCISAFSC